MSANKWQGRIYLGRDDDNKERYHWVGRYRTRKERNDAVAAEKVRIERDGCDCKDCGAMGRKGVARQTVPTIGEQLDRYLAAYRRANKESSWETQTTRTARLRADHGDRPITDLQRPELKDWIVAEGEYEGKEPVPISHVPAIVSFYNWSIDDDEVPLPKSPARGLSDKRGAGRSGDAPPTEEEFQRLLDACSVHGAYAPMARAVIEFATFELARPGEAFEVKETDIDFKRMRISKARRLYRGKVDTAKTGAKVIALTPPAAQAIRPILPGDGGYVLRNKSGDQLTSSTWHGYWKEILIAAGLDFDFYLATKHYGVWFFWNVLGMSEQTIAAQAGWKLSSVRTLLKLLETYGHGDIGALDNVDKAFEGRETTRSALRLVKGGSR